ncbi:MAG TPA: PEP-CTERM sorting domain-containing protein, partial [Pirellulales bacterium]|nr:PEP-CTERM sorting domain-containing protein [Pirellulales bacterium]
FTIMTDAGVSGTFSSVTGTTAGPGLTYSVIYEPTAIVVLTTANGCNTWGVDSDGSLSSGANYVGNSAPNGIGAVATLSNIITVNRTITVDADTTLGTLNFDSQFNYTLTGQHKLTMQAPSGAHASINVSNVHGNGSHTIDSQVVMKSDLNIVQNSSSPLNLAGGLDNSIGKQISTGGSGEVSVSGPVNLGPGSQLAVKGSSTLQMGLKAGQQATVGTAVQAQVSDNATLELAGAVSGLVDSAAASPQNRADIKNNSSAQVGVHVTGTNQVVGGIDGTGNTAVEAGADLTANHIVQYALMIGGKVGSPGKVTLQASDSQGRPLDSGLDSVTSLGVAKFLPTSDPLAIDSTGLPSMSSPTDLGSGSDALPAISSAASGSLATGSPVVPEPSSFILASLGVALAVAAGLRFRTR